MKKLIKVISVILTVWSFLGFNIYDSEASKSEICYTENTSTLPIEIPVDSILDTEPISNNNQQESNIVDSKIATQPPAEEIVEETEESTSANQKEENEEEKIDIVADKNENEEETSQQYYNNNVTICEADGWVDPYWVTRVNNKLSCLPASVIDTFRNTGWHIYATSKDLDQEWFNGQYGAVRGCTWLSKKIICIEDREDAMTAPCHEFGHWFDWYCGMPSDTEEFYEIYYSETNAFENAFIVDFYYNNKELFAEGFQKYYTDNEVLKQNCPQLYNFLDNLLTANGFNI